MATEIERKFLVVGDAWREKGDPVRFRQGYLSTDPERTVRVRVAGGVAALTVKGRTVGAARSEFEYPIPVADAERMLDELALAPVIEKTRTRISYGEHVWEVDEFFGENAGLIVAEVELRDENETPELPSWLGREVTGEVRFYNSALLLRPYRWWSEEEKR